MKKYFIEYPKNHMYVCFDGRDGYVSFKIEYLFVEFVSRNKRLLSAFKRVLKLKDKSSGLNTVICMIIDQFEREPKRSEHGEFKYVIMPDKNEAVINENEVFPCIHIFTGDEYYENTYCGEMMFNKLKKKLPMIGIDF